jgi:hypothetical protein
LPIIEHIAILTHNLLRRNDCHRFALHLGSRVHWLAHLGRRSWDFTKNCDWHASVEKGPLLLIQLQRLVVLINFFFLGSFDWIPRGLKLLVLSHFVCVNFRWCLPRKCDCDLSKLLVN